MVSSVRRVGSPCFAIAELQGRRHREFPGLQRKDCGDWAVPRVQQLHGAVVEGIDGKTVIDLQDIVEQWRGPCLQRGSNQVRTEQVEMVHVLNLERGHSVVMEPLLRAGKYWLQLTGANLLK